MANGLTTQTLADTWRGWCRKNLPQYLWMQENDAYVDSYTGDKNIIFNNNFFAGANNRIFFLASTFDKDVNLIRITSDWGWSSNTPLILIPLGGVIETNSEGTSSQSLNISDMENVFIWGFLFQDAPGFLKRGNVGRRDFGWSLRLNNANPNTRMMAWEGNTNLTDSRAIGVFIENGFSADRTGRNIISNYIKIYRWNCLYDVASEGEGTYWCRTQLSFTAPVCSIEASFMMMKYRGTEPWQHQDSINDPNGGNYIKNISLITGATTRKRPFQPNQDYSGQIDMLQGDMVIRNIISIGGYQHAFQFFSDDRTGRNINPTGTVFFFNVYIARVGNNPFRIHGSMEFGPDLLISNINIQNIKNDFSEVGGTVNNFLVSQGKTPNTGKNIQFFDIKHYTGAIEFFQDPSDNTLYNFENTSVDETALKYEDMFQDPDLKGLTVTNDPFIWTPYYGYNINTFQFLEQSHFKNIISFSAGNNPATHTRINYENPDIHNQAFTITKVWIYGSAVSSQNGTFNISSINSTSFEIDIPFTSDGGQAKLLWGEDLTHPIPYTTDSLPSTNFAADIVIDPSEEDGTHYKYFPLQTHNGNSINSRPHYDVFVLGNGIRGTYWEVIRWDAAGFPSYHSNFNDQNGPITYEYAGDFRAKDGTFLAEQRLGVPSHWQNPNKTNIIIEIAKSLDDGSVDENNTHEIPGYWSEVFDAYEHYWIDNGDYFRYKIIPVDGTNILAMQTTPWTLISGLTKSI